MNQTPLTYEQLEETFVPWAQQQPDIHAAIIVESRARVDHPSDQWSDLDLILFIPHPQADASQADWLEEIGEV
jgi:aminoglycoside 6-adenylyltransferase